MGDFLVENACPIYKGACLFATPNPTNTYLCNKAERSCNASSVHYLIGGDGNDFEFNWFGDE